MRPLRPQLLPQAGEYGMGRHPQVLLYLLDRARARYGRCDGRVGQAELQGSRLQRHAVAVAHILDAAGPLHHLTRRGQVVEGRLVRQVRRQDAAVVRPAQDDADALLVAQGQQLVEAGLVEQRVPARQQEAVGVGLAGRTAPASATGSSPRRQPRRRPGSAGRTGRGTPRPGPARSGRPGRGSSRRRPGPGAGGPGSRRWTGSTPSRE